VSAPTKFPREELRRAERCPRFDGCSAPVCPLMGMGGTHLRGEPVCFFLREAVKVGGEARLRLRLPEDLATAVVEAGSVAIALQGDIGRALRRASKQGSKRDGAAHARQAKSGQRARTPHIATDMAESA
jgi:hypothetical protein